MDRTDRFCTYLRRLSLVPFRDAASRLNHEVASDKEALRAEVHLAALVDALLYWLDPRTWRRLPAHLAAMARNGWRLVTTTAAPTRPRARTRAARPPRG